MLWLALLGFAALTGDQAFALNGRRSQFVFGGLCIAAFMVNRWPLLFNPTALNPDEAQMAAQAIKALSDPLPWHGFDGTTSGPLNSYILTAPRIMGFPISMESTHLVAAALELGTVFALQSAVAKLFGALVGRGAALIMLAFYAFAQEFNFVHYSSEHLPVFLVACGLCTLADAYGRARPSLACAALGGFALGLAPFAKLQALLLAAYVAATVVLVFAVRPAPPNLKRRRIGYFLAGGIGAVGLLITLTAAGGSLHDAIVTYILSNAAYSRNATSLGARFFLSPDPFYAAFMFGAISLSVLLGAMAVWCPPNRHTTRIVAFAGGLTLVGIWTVCVANHPFQHYLLFAILPIASMTAVLAGTVYRDWRASGTPIPARSRATRGSIARRFIFAAIAGTIVVPSLLQQLVLGNSFTHDAPAYFTYRDGVAAGLRQIIPANTRIAVWGWMPQYYVETQTIMATKDAHTYAEIVPGPYRDYFRTRYMQAMLDDPPSYFVDSVAPGAFSYTDRAIDGFEVFPQLAAFIADDYRLVAEVYGVRVYRRKTS